MQLRGDISMKQILYINGDSWLSHFTSRVANNQHPLFNDIFVINHSIPGDGNANIIARTKQALDDFKEIGIKPWVCLGLSEIGRNLADEFKLVRPTTDNISEYLELVAKAELKLAEDILNGYNHYVCNTWVSNSNNTTKSIIDFIDQDFSTVDPCYTIGNSIYNWFVTKPQIFKFTKSSMLKAIENKQKFEKLLLSNQYVNGTLHLDKLPADLIYERFFQHVLFQLKNNKQATK